MDRTEGKIRDVAIWALQIISSAIFIASGLSKLLSAPGAVSLFQMIGPGPWFRYSIGALEMLCALALLTPKFCGLGASVIVLILAGAAGVHLLKIRDSPSEALLLLAVAGSIAWARRDRTRRLLHEKRDEGK